MWFHDLPRSFVNNSRGRGIPESVVMRMSGRTRDVFDRYNIVEDEDVRNALKVIEAGAANDLAENTARERGRAGEELEEVGPKERG